MPVSVIVPVRNEELNVRAALATVHWADEVWVVDSSSTDRTSALAQECGAQVVQFVYDGGSRKKKNWALDTLPLRNEWVFLLDGDERVTPELLKEIANAVMNPSADGYMVDREYYFLGRSLRCFRPDWNMRLFRHAAGRFEILGTTIPNTGDVEVHEHVVLSGRSGYLKSPLLHLDRRPIRAWLENHVRYSEWEAGIYEQLASERFRLADILEGDAMWRRRALKRIWVRLPFRPFFRFVIYYFLRRGILDGSEGFLYSVGMGFYEFMISLRLAELRRSARAK